MKEKLKEIIRSVPITDKAYPEYVEALAEKLIDADGCQMAEELKCEVATEIFAVVDSMLSLVCDMIGIDIRFYGRYAELKKKYTEDK